MKIKQITEYGAMFQMDKLWSKPEGSQQHLLRKSKKKKKKKKVEGRIEDTFATNRVDKHDRPEKKKKKVKEKAPSDAIYGIFVNGNDVGARFAELRDAKQLAHGLQKLYRNKKVRVQKADPTKMMTTEEVTSGDRNIALNLPRGEMKVLKAEEKDYDRGLLVKLLDDGGYEMAYWYEKHVPFPVEVIVDGKSIKKDAEIVEMKFHPELKPGEEDKVNQFRIYDIEADLNDLKKMLKQANNKDV